MVMVVWLWVLVEDQEEGPCKAIAGPSMIISISRWMKCERRVIELLERRRDFVCEEL